MIRSIDIIISLAGLIILLPLLVFISIIGWLETRSPFFRQKRVGLHQKSFILVKFRTMKLDTASVATHLTDTSAITLFGKFLRGTKLDEIPQLWNVLKGDMSLVGARPCLFNQEELVRERNNRSVYNYRPGVTGLAQIRGIDMSTPKLLAETDATMLMDLNIFSYFKYILFTAIGKGFGDRVKPDA